MTAKLSSPLAIVVAAALGIATITAGGLSANNYLLQAGTSLAMYVALAYAWNIVGGYMGYPSFGTAAFFGLGAYIGGILQNYGWPLGAAWVAAGLGGAFFAACLGSVLLGMRGHYFAIGTIAVLEVMREVANNWEQLTGGAIGLNLPIMSGTPREVGIFFFFAMWSGAALTLIATWLISRSKFGFGLRCIKQNEEAARMVGIDVFRFKVAAFGISSGIMSAIGAVYASMVAFIAPGDVFSILMSIGVPVMVTLGGAGTVLGPLVGAVLYMVLNEIAWVNFISYHASILGLLIIAVIYFIPQGVLREIQKRFQKTGAASRTKTANRAA
jgi:branched-chain amino acid transport system permease protein